MVKVTDSRQEDLAVPAPPPKLPPPPTHTQGGPVGASERAQVSQV